MAYPRHDHRSWPVHPYRCLHDNRRYALNNAIEGIEPSPEMAALFAMFLQERAPLPVSEPFLDCYIRNVLV